MSNKNKYNRDEGYNSDRERPEGWFDPERFRENRNRRNQDGHSSYQQTSNPNYVDRFNQMNRQRMQNEYPDRESFNRQYGNVNDRGFRDDRDMYNDSVNRHVRYGDNFNQYPRRGEEQSGNYNEGRSGNNDERGWWDKTSDEVASWFGDDKAEQRRRMDKLNGPHRGKGPKGYSRTDDRIKEDISECLYQDSYIDATEVEVNVQNGEAIITGTVDSKDCKHRVEDIVESIPGVKDVENRLKVNQSSSPSSRSGTDRDRWNV